MAGKSTGFTVELFDGHNNFTLWQQRVKNILVREGLVKALKPKSKRPEEMKEEKWEEMRELANSTIQLYLGNSTLREVINETDPAELWAKLESRHKSKSLTNRLSLKKQLYALYMSEGGNFNDHLDEFNRLLTELEAIGAKIEEEDKAILLLVSLPPSYEHLRTTLIYGKDTLGLDEVVATLLSHESMRRNESEKILEERVLVTSDCRGRTTTRQHGSKPRGRSYSRGGESRGVDKRKCYFCDEEGHIIKFCPKLKAKKDEEKESFDAAVVESYSENEGDLLTVTSEGTKNFDWVMDSGCSFHMCSNRKYFCAYGPCDGSVVRMANNTVNKVVGIGIVRFRMADGRIVRLTGVRHVPGLRKNLISLGMLHSNGCTFATRDGFLEAFKNDKVVLQGKIVGNLYKLQGRVEAWHASIGHQASKRDRHQITQVWRAKKQANDSHCVDRNIEKELVLVMNSEKMEEKLCAKKRVSFAPNLISDVFE